MTIKICKEKCENNHKTGNLVIIIGSIIVLLVLEFIREIMLFDLFASVLWIFEVSIFLITLSSGIYGYVGIVILEYKKKKLAL